MPRSRLVVAITLLGLLGCGAQERSADFAVPGSDLVLEVGLEHGHLYLAEYARTLTIKSGGEVIASEKLYFDTGGYARVNVYRLDPVRLLLSTEGDYDYVLEQPSKTLSRTPVKNHERPTGAKYVGAFDWSAPGVWQFVRASDRDEIPIGAFGPHG